MTYRSLLLAALFTLGTFALRAQPAVQEFRAELMNGGASSPGRLIVAGDQIVFLSEARPEDSFFVPRANIQTVTPDRETIVLQLREPIRDGSGERLRLTFRLADERAATALAGWQARAPSAAATVSGESARTASNAQVLSFPARHKKIFGGSKGRLLVTATGLAYESIDDVTSSRRWDYKDIRELKLKNPYEIEVKPFGGDDYTLALDGQGMDKADYDTLVDRITKARAVSR